jgi:hypothetical protein
MHGYRQPCAGRATAVCRARKRTAEAVCFEGDGNEPGAGDTADRAARGQFERSRYGGERKAFTASYTPDDIKLLRRWTRRIKP